MKRLACEMCGSIDIVRKGNMSVCDSCGTKFADAGQEHSVIRSQHLNMEAEKLLEFKINETEVRKVFNEWLVSGDFTPQDILNTVSIEKTKKLFASTWYLYGSYTGGWTASSGYDRSEEYTQNGKKETRTRTVTDWRPSNGLISGSFITLKFANDTINFKLGNVVADKTQWKINDVVEFNDYDVTEYELLPYQLSKEEAYSNYEPELETKVKREIRVPGDHYKDLTYHYNINYSGTMIYYPVYLYDYTYNGKPYNAIIDARDANNIFGTRPTDEKLIKSLKKSVSDVYICIFLGYASTIGFGTVGFGGGDISMGFFLIAISLIFLADKLRFGIEDKIKKANIARTGGADIDTSKYSKLDLEATTIHNSTFETVKSFTSVSLVVIIVLCVGMFFYFKFMKDYPIII